MFKPANYGLVALEFLWEHYSNYDHSAQFCSLNWSDEFFFCLLGGYSISYELNFSAFNVLKKKGLLEAKINWHNTNQVVSRFEAELRKPQFTPLLKDGNFRCYRFPQKKAMQISSAGYWFTQTYNFNFDQMLSQSADARINRKCLMCCPGIGYKSASWFLRNIGKGDELAIIDVHVFRVLRELGIIDNCWSIDKNYLEIEDCYLYACEKIGARPDLFDLIIWSWDRGNIERNEVYTN